MMGRTAEFEKAELSATRSSRVFGFPRRRAHDESNCRFVLATRPALIYRSAVRTSMTSRRPQKGGLRYLLKVPRRVRLVGSSQCLMRGISNPTPSVVKSLLRVAKFPPS